MSSNDKTLFSFMAIVAVLSIFTLDVLTVSSSECRDACGLRGVERQTSTACVCGDR
jgi:hypothetical protein